MPTVKIDIEHPLNSTSQKTVWQLIGTTEGLSRWVADRVTLDGSVLTFTWGDEWYHHETRHATLLRLDRLSRIRWHWDGDDDDTFVEIRMERGTLSDEFTLHITDFADDGDTDWLHSAWQHNFDNLRQRSGI